MSGSPLRMPTATCESSALASKPFSFGNSNIFNSLLTLVAVMPSGRSLTYPSSMPEASAVRIAEKLSIACCLLTFGI